MHTFALVAALLISACSYDYSRLQGRGGDAGGLEVGHPDGGQTDTSLDSVLEDSDGPNDGTTPVDSIDTSDLPDSAPRPLGAGCAADGQCASGVCANASGGTKQCCDGKPSACSPCVNGFLTALSDGETADGCARCTGGRTSNINEGGSCGAHATCGGPMFSSGFGDGTSLYSTVATNFVCHSGTCTSTAVDCTAKTCPGCPNKQYLGCFVDSSGSAGAADGGADPVSGAACRCVDKGGSFCSAAL